MDATAPGDDDAQLVEGLRAGDEVAFTRLFQRHHPMLIRLARAYVGEASAEEIAQDVWVSAMDALASFEGRSTFKTWIARIAINRAKTRAVREGRSVGFDDGDDDRDAHEPAVDPSRFYSWGLWASWPDRWAETPDALSMRREVREAIEEGLQRLNAAQRSVVTLRDLEGWTSEEVCNALGLSESNQRVLLHRGRAKLRAVLERVLKEAKP